MVTPAAKRDAVAPVRSVFESSERRACRIIGRVRMTVRSYTPRRPEHTASRERLKAFALATAARSGPPPPPPTWASPTTRLQFRLDKKWWQRHSFRSWVECSTRLHDFENPLKVNM
jgi:hypothetical protein